MIDKTPCQDRERLTRPINTSAATALDFAVAHLNVSLPKRVSAEELLGCLLNAKPFTASEHHVGEFLNEADLGTLSDLAASGAVSYEQLAHAAELHLPSRHATRRWLDDRKGF